MKISTQTNTIQLESRHVQEIINTIGIDACMDELMVRMELAFRNYSTNETVIPKREGFNYKSPTLGLVEWMPIWQKDKHVIIKVVGYHPKNPSDFGLPTILSTISKYSTKTGHLMGLVDGVILTALRTGAASAIASKHLALSKSKKLGLIGCGAQSITQIHAISRVFDINEVLIYDTSEIEMASFNERISVLNLNIKVTKSDIDSIAQSVDILCTATSIEGNLTPLFEDLTYQKHLHINAVGSDFPGKVELPISYLEKAFICPDFIEQALIEGECQRIPREQIDTDIASLIQNNNSQDTQSGLTLFDSTGWALEDEVVFDLFLDYAQELGIGNRVQLEFIPDNPKDIYHFVNSTNAVEAV